MLRYRLDSQLTKLKKCPPVDCDEREQEAFRFVSSPIRLEDFLTHFEKNPNIYREKCMAYSLSFFDSLESAKRRYIGDGLI